MPLPDFGPNGLLPDGVHPATREELEARFVTAFPTSTTRPAIFAGFVNYQDALELLGLNVTQWVDGSFTDQTRREPEDVDIVNFCQVEDFDEALTRHGVSRVLKLVDGGEATKVNYKTHSFVCVQFPRGHAMAAKFETQRTYWRKWFATPQDYSSRQKVPAPLRGRKGIVQMTIGDAKLSPKVSTAK